MPIWTVNGLPLHVQQGGSGPDVVLIHGVTGDLSIWFLCRAMQSLDTGRIVAGHRTHAVQELEIELKEGDRAATIEVARQWCETHGLWLEFRQVRPLR